MLEAKNDNKDKNDIDINENTSGTVGFDPKTGRVYYVDDPEKKVKEEDMPTKEELEKLKADLEQNTQEIKDLLKTVGIDDLSDLEALKNLGNEDK